MSTDPFDYLEARDDADGLIDDFGAPATVRRYVASGPSWDPTLTPTDYPTLAVILDAEIVTNKRRFAAPDFFQDLFTTPLEQDEIVCEVVFPVANGPHKYVKFRRRLFDWAIVAAAAQQLDGGWRIGLTNVGPTPVRCSSVERALAQGATPEQAAEAASDGLNPSGDLRASPEYKKHLARVLTKRAIQQAT